MTSETDKKLTPLELILLSSALLGILFCFARFCRDWEIESRAYQKAHPHMHE